MPRILHDWKAIQTYHDAGHGFVECRRRFRFSHFAWINAIKRGALKVVPAPFADRRRKFDWAEVQAFYDAGHTYRATRVHFGFSSGTWYKALQRGAIKSRPFGMPISELLSSPKRSRSHIKSRLINARLLDCQCQRCGLQEWMGQPMSMHLDHVNGIKNDNRLENLRMLCPNCHSQTPTYSGRNVTRARRLQEVRRSCSITDATDPG